MPPSCRTPEKEPSKEIRIFFDGAFDMFHYGHMNALRLAKSVGTTLIVGVNSDESITECKGAPLMNEDERTTMIRSCKFVDDVIPCPYIMNEDYIKWLIEEHHIDFVVHGDDPCLVDGKDVYATAKAIGKFRTIPRTEGISTTDLVGRILQFTNEKNNSNRDDSEFSTLGSQSKFLATSNMMQLFNMKTAMPSDEMRVVYVDGDWDMFHPGHVALLKEARQRGDYLIVGVHSDMVVNRIRGKDLPILNLHERVLSVLGCRYVDDVVIDAPYVISPQLMTILRISEVVQVVGEYACHPDQLKTRYQFVMEANIFSLLENSNTFHLKRIIERVKEDQEKFQAKFERKMQAENEFYRDKYACSQLSKSLSTNNKTA